MTTKEDEKMEAKLKGFKSDGLVINELVGEGRGFQFCPTEQELIMAYLKKKVMDEPLEPNPIIEVEIYKFNPQQLSNRKYTNGKRPKRSTLDGYWKAIRKCQSIHSEDGTTLIGKWRTLVYYEGTYQQSKKTHWIMCEYFLDEITHARTSPLDMKLDDWVLCKIYKNNKNYKNSCTEKETWLEPLRMESIQMTCSLQILPQPPQSQLESDNMDQFQFNNPHSSEISHAFPGPASFYEIINKKSSSDDVWKYIDLENLDTENNDPMVSSMLPSMVDTTTSSVTFHPEMESSSFIFI
ncbi:NAC transcription factor 29-like [Prosopis cineraria]|uniref:NAC transcription factor 29-like n=1 Tax=Prosopis cineraria TaxID=364024 RepID=UPI00240EF0D2|nr:NAC transcription factor 29-like [Prosopis cineraria]